ncbi:hypothetical protein Dimus_026881 [Dionaea muscipula]
MTSLRASSAVPLSCRVAIARTLAGGAGSNPKASSAAQETAFSRKRSFRNKLKKRLQNLMPWILLRLLLNAIILLSSRYLDSNYLTEGIPS